MASNSTSDSSVIQNSQEVETTLVSIDRKMDK